ELLPATADEQPEVVALDVQARGVAARGDLDRAVDAHQREHLGQDRLRGLERRSLLVRQLLDRLAGDERCRLATAVGAWLAWLSRWAVGPTLTITPVAATAAAATTAARATLAVGSGWRLVGQ